MASPAEQSPKQESAYRRLPGRGRRTSGFISLGASVSTIWLRDDHILVRESVYGLSETYKRFYFRDIQAIVVRRTQRWLAWIVVWTSCSFLFLFWSIAARWQSVAWGVFWPGLCFFLAMVKLARGPSCVTHLVTAVQRELLGSLNTVRKARRVLKILVPLIEEKQGRFEPESPGILARPSPQRAVSAPPTSFALPASAPLPLARSRVHLLLFATILAGGVSALWETFWSSGISLAAATVSLAVIIVLSVITLVYQSRRRVQKSVAVLTWTSMVGYIVAWMVIYMAYSIMNGFEQAARQARQPDQPFQAIELTPMVLRRMPGFLYVLFLYGACSIALGVAGIGAVFLGRGSAKRPPPLPGQVD